MSAHRILVFADSLAFHGPQQVEAPATAGLFPNVCARELGAGVGVDLVARLGYTARDGWWALTKDPVVWGTYLPRAKGVVLALGQYDQLPAAIPTWLRESIPYLRPGTLRRRVRTGYLWAAPRIMTATGGRLTTLGDRASNHYLTRITDGIRYLRPGLPIVRLLPAHYDSALYPPQRPHRPAVESARAWCTRMGVPAVDLDELVDLRTNNPDGLHWGWDTHDRIGRATAQALVTAGLEQVAA